MEEENRQIFSVVSASAGRLTRLRELILQLARLNTKWFLSPEPLPSGEAESVRGLAWKALREIVTLSRLNVSYYNLTCLFMVVCFVCLSMYPRVRTCMCEHLCVCVGMHVYVSMWLFVCFLVCLYGHLWVCVSTHVSLYRCFVYVHV